MGGKVKMPVPVDDDDEKWAKVATMDGEEPLSQSKASESEDDELEDDDSSDNVKGSLVDIVEDGIEEPKNASTGEDSGKKEDDKEKQEKQDDDDKENATEEKQDENDE